MVASLLLASANEIRSDILFAVFLLIFCATAIITLLGIVGKAKIREGYLKALFTALILEVVGVIIAIAKTTLTPMPQPPVPDDYQVWTVMGKMDMSHSHLSPSGVPYVGIEIQPQPAMDASGIFDFYVAAPRIKGTYEVPTVRFVDPEAKQFREIHLDPKWSQYEEVKIDRNVKDHIANISPFLLLPLPSSPGNTEGAATDASKFRSSDPLKVVTASTAGLPAASPHQSP